MTDAVLTLSGGAQTTVQDLGRPGLRHLGAPQGGASDPLSCALANVAVGNPVHAAVLECTLAGPVLQFNEKSVFAIAGADMNARLNDRPISQYEPHTVDPGAILTLAGAKTGMRTYIAFRGGIVADVFLSSASTYLPAQIGGLNGRALLPGDTISFMTPGAKPPTTIPQSYRPTFGHDWVLRALPGPEITLITESERQTLFTKPFTLENRCDRMGLRLNGSPLTPDLTSIMASSAVYPGTLQCPPDGSPFLLLSDGQTTGGYPRLLQVCAVDLSLLGQLQPGDRIWFREISIENALDLLLRKTALYSGLLEEFNFG